MNVLRAYSGGTVRDFHPIPYSPAKKQALGQYYFIIILYAKCAESQYEVYNSAIYSKTEQIFFNRKDFDKRLWLF